MPTNPETKSSSSFVARWKSVYVDADHPRPMPAAFLFSGPIGSGKHHAAEEITRCLLGRTDGHPDFIRIQPEKNAIKIEAVRQLIHRLSLKPFEKDRIVIVIEDADALTEGAANSLLKTLEEPADYVLFLLLTAKPERLLPTIRSRCQRVNFQVPDESLKTRLDQVYQEWREELASVLKPGAASFSAASRLAESVSAEAERLPSLFEVLRSYWRDLAVWQKTGDPSLLLLPSAQASIQAKAGRRAADAVFTDTDLILETERAVEGNVNKMLALERLFARLIA